VDELIGSNPVDRAKRPRVQVQEPGTVWTVAQLQAFLDTARQHLWVPKNLRRLGRCFSEHRRLGNANGAWRASMVLVGMR
jgi:hypothetical protein